MSSRNKIQINFIANNTSYTLDLNNDKTGFSQVQLAVTGTFGGGQIEIYDVISDVATPNVEYEIPWKLSWGNQTTSVGITENVAGFVLVSLSQSSKIKFKLTGATSPNLKMFLKGVIGISEDKFFIAS
jgi:hypothetical protein